MTDKKNNPSLVDNFLNRKIEQELDNRAFVFLHNGFSANFRAWINGGEDLCAEEMVKHTKDKDLVDGNEALAQLKAFQTDRKLPKKAIKK